MIYEHTTHPRLISNVVRIVLAGCGGSGSQMLTGLARLDIALRALGHPGFEILAFDPDDVAQANLGRQLFAAADVGRNKAHVLVNRLNAWHGTAYTAADARFDHRAAHGINGGRPDIVISCVDSAKARIGIADALRSNPSIYWLDLGNRQADGQFVLGIPPVSDEHEAFEFRLPTVLELFPEMRTDKTLDRDAGPSCSLAQALERQELFVNQAVVTPALNLLWQIFRTSRTSWCGGFVNLKSGRTTPLPVDPKAWARFGHHSTNAKEPGK